MTHAVAFGNRCLGENHPALIVAEVGINHNGDLATAKQMIRVAAECGVDAVKFQSFRAAEFVGGSQEVTYESDGFAVQESMQAMFRRYELPYEALAELADCARQAGILFFSSPADIHALQILVELGVPGIKIGSDDLTNLPLLRAFAQAGLPLILSTGMAQLGEVEEAVETVRAAGNDDLVILHCVSLYPTPLEQVHLRRMETLRHAFDAPIGFSDHTEGVTAALGATALGACLIEKHFTLDTRQPGPDHHFSADPTTLRQLVAGVRGIEAALGRSVFALSPEEQAMRHACHRSIVARVPIPAGTRLTPEHLTLKRPGTGLPPRDWDTLIGRIARVALTADQPITWEVV
jgi:N-acetylneuraminate synthase/N,N'-diacetyllegionaminate synthase